MESDRLHRIELADGWTTWRWAELRTAGFPASMLLDLASSELTRAVDALLEATRAAEVAREHAIAELRRELAALPADARKPLRKTLDKVLRGGEPVLAPGLSAAVTDAVTLLTARTRELRAGEAAAETLLAAEQGRASDLFKRMAATERFREAVVWQNRRLVETVLDALLRTAPDRTDAKTRQRERMVASYMQRYCAKNDTIGFFGPIAWATIADDPRQQVIVEPGADLIARRTVYFEHWAIDAVAEVFASDPDVRPHLCPRRMPTVRLEGTTLYHSGGSRDELPEVYAALLARCDGNTPACELAEQLMADEALELSDASEVYELLEQLYDKRLVTWTLEVPVGLVPPAPERPLAALLERITNPEVRSRVTAKLDALVAARDEIATAAGNVAGLDRAMAALETTFHEITGLAAVRNQGQTYAGRTLIYEECVRDVSCQISRGVFDEVAPALSLVFASARWFTAEIGRRCRVLARETFDRLRGAEPAVEYLRFWEDISPQITFQDGVEPDIVRTVASELQAHWTRILLGDADMTANHVTRSVEELAPQTREWFSARAPGWLLARFQAPDLMIAAESTDAIRDGNFSVVLGELHIGGTSLLSIGERQDRDVFYRAAAHDVPETTLSPVDSKKFVSRADYPPLKPTDYQLETGASRSTFPRSHVLAIADLVVCDENDSLVVRTLDGKHRFDLMAVLGNYLTFAAVSSFRILPHAAHSPRVSIGKLVVERERWSFDPASIAFRDEEDALERFCSARRWARERGLPRFVFAKMPEEKKPFYVDFDSPTYVELLAARLRQASVVMFSEMLPGLNELWLRDADGRAYTSELRMVVVDPAGASR